MNASKRVVRSPSFYVLVPYRLRDPGFGSFVSQEEAEEYRAGMPDGRGWHIVHIGQPEFTPAQLTRRLVASGFYGTGYPHDYGQPCSCPDCGDDESPEQNHLDDTGGIS